jgi:heme oxygenase
MSAKSRAEIFANRLREATRPAHRALDHHPILAPLSRSPLSLSVYARALAALHGPQQAIECLLGSFAPGLQFPPRLADLERDLSTLGASPFPLMAEIPEYQSESQLLGVMYVIEGSNLGGAVIARQLALGLPITAPRDFFGKSGGPSRWENFWRFAASHFLDDNIAIVEDAACTIFGLYKEHLDRCQVESSS